jgi:hypothetical protein
MLLALAVPLFAQEQAQEPASKPQVHYNYLNVCTPGEAEKAEIADSLKKIPEKPQFSPDFEISRGRTSMENAQPALYVRLRRELSGSSFFGNVQYSISRDEKSTTENLTLKVRDPKDLLLVTLEDTVSSDVTSPASLLAVNTPASRIKLEHFGKPSLVLARCPTADQSAYEALFREATQILAQYRRSLGLKTVFRNEIAWLAREEQKPAKAVAPKKK